MAEVPSMLTSSYLLVNEWEVIKSRTKQEIGNCTTIDGDRGDGKKDDKRRPKQEASHESNAVGRRRKKAMGATERCIGAMVGMQPYRKEKSTHYREGKKSGEKGVT
jgi:hypothetical protein